MQNLVEMGRNFAMAITTESTRDILAIANSFTNYDPVRKSFLSAPLVRRILDRILGGNPVG
jgi:hypothetical protein